MGWAFGTDGLGRDIGYGVAADCDQFSCMRRINRGMDFRCGDLGCETDDGMPGCGGYFCEAHRTSWTDPEGGESMQLCLSCTLTLNTARMVAQNAWGDEEGGW